LLNHSELYTRPYRSARLGLFIVAQLQPFSRILFLDTRISNIETRRVLETNAALGVDDTLS